MKTTSTLLRSGALLLGMWAMGSGAAAVDEPTQAPKVETSQPNPWEKDIRAFEESDKIHPPPADAVLFLGSSSIRKWVSVAKDFPEIPVINRGFGGSQLSDSVVFAGRIVVPYKPRLVVVYAGGNDIQGGKSAEQVAQSFRELADKIHATLPQTPVVYISLNPTIHHWKDDDKLREANRLIEKWTKTAPKTAFIDSYSGLIGADGKPQTALLESDGLHLNRQGYQAWLQILKPRILKMYEDARPPANP